jgi:hypothetical protein
MRNEIKKMPLEKRDEEYKSVINQLYKFETPEKILTDEIIVDLIGSISHALILSKVSLEENFEDDNNFPQSHVRSMVKNTTSFVQRVMSILKQNNAANNFINILKEKSTGSILGHMNSVFLLFSTFCYFYNLSIARGKILKIRADYKSKYFKYYKKLMPEDPPNRLEDVFHGGIMDFNADQLLMFSIGAMFHDIGKVDNISYYEGSESYDRKLIMSHAPTSYNMIAKTMEFDSEVALFAALHHEYYNDSTTGYGISKSLFPDKAKKYKTCKYCLTYNVEDLKSGYAMAYVPIKMFEIIDVFDALTDETRKYREKEFEIDEALKLMKSDFIEKSLRLDPILFSFFLDYIKYFAFLKDESLLERLSIK